MELIKDIGVKAIVKTDGTSGARQMHSMFACPRCEEEVVKPRTKGLRDKTCGSEECKKAQMIEAQGIIANRTRGSNKDPALFKTGDLSPSNKKSRIHPLYRVWGGMKKRCYNKNEPKYPRYGGRGITVCDRWINSFENFYDDMQKEYFIMKIKAKSDHKLKPTLDRIDKDGIYTAKNCQWLGLSNHSMKDVKVLAVEAYDPDTGVTLRSFRSATEASYSPVIINFCGKVIEKQLNVAHILACCRGTRTHTLYTYWRFVNKTTLV